MPHGELQSDEISRRSGEPSSNRRIGLTRGGAILLEPDGFRLMGPRTRKQPRLHPYESMTHIHAADRALLIGLTTGLVTIPRRDFSDPGEGPVEARSALLARLADRPDGQRWIGEMADVDRLGNRKAPSWVTWATAVLCVVGTWFQLGNPMLEQAGAFVPDLFERGEYWRAVTAHFLHGLSSAPPFVTLLFGNVAGLPFHLAINVGGLLVLGNLVERPMGSWKTAIVLASGAVGAMGGIFVAEHFEVIGASGLVSAFAGAILALELNYPNALPSYWRLPRRLFIAAVILQFFVVDPLLSSWVAGGAHLGGFAGGFLAAWFMGRPSYESLVPTSRVRLAAYCTVAILILGILGSLPLTRHDMGALERHATRLLNTPPAVNLYRHENAAAWFIATDGAASPFDLDLAVALADRAVASTGRMHPGILDTLAEALFQTGNVLGALHTINEAIRLVPNEAYFIEQRRRFIGERAAEDRPPPPGSAREGEPSFEDDFELRPLDSTTSFLTI